MKYLFLLFVLIGFTNAHAGCSEWRPTPATSCSFLSEWTQIWTRTCQDPCIRQGNQVICNLERICTNEDPNDLKAPCTAWREDRGTTCVNPVTRKYEQKWARACTQNFSVVLCSDQNPNE